MKKLILLVAVAAFGVTLNSCSSDDSGSQSTGSSITVKVDGVARTFNNVVVTEQPETIDGVTFTNLSVKGSTDDPSETITFQTAQFVTGSDFVYSFRYKKSGVTYFDGNDAFTTDIQTNSSSKLKGTFSGILANSTETQVAVLTEGTFNISY